MSVSERSGRFSYEGRSLAFTEYGEGPRTVVLLHGLLLSRRMHEPLARSLAERGHRVLTLDLLGHGESDRPVDPACYSMTVFGKQTIALLDHLEVEEAVVLGTSLGANAALEASAFAPERLRGMVIEMPVLDGALLACALAFTPLMVALTFGEPMMRGLQLGARLVPRLPWMADFLLDSVRQDPAPGAAVLQGLFFGRIAPHRTERRTFETPALVIGHQFDIVHPFSDAGMLVEELPNGRLLQASSILELRLAPERLTGEIAEFVDDCWRPKPARKPTRRRRASG
jgi:pimeloyl-ACP methyl ester carboxylesterase